MLIKRVKSKSLEREDTKTKRYKLMLSTVFHATSCDFKCSGDNKLILQYLEIITWVLDFLSNAVHNYVSRARESIL